MTRLILFLIYTSLLIPATLTNEYYFYLDPLYRKGDYKGVIKMADYIMNKISNSDYYVLYYKGLSEYRISEYSNSINTLLKACELITNDSQVINGLANSYYRINDYGNAKLYYSLAASLSNDFYAIRGMARCEAIDKNYILSAKYISILYKIDENNPFCDLEYAYLYYAQNNKSRCYEYLKKSISKANAIEQGLLDGIITRDYLKNYIVKDKMFENIKNEKEYREILSE